MILDGTSFPARGDGVAFQTAERVMKDLGARVTYSGGVPQDSHFDDIRVSAFGQLDLGYPLPANAHAVHAVGGALMAQWSYEPGPVLLSTPYSEVALGAALGMLALARRLQLWSGTGVSALESLFVLQSGAYSYGEEPRPDRWDESPRGQHPTYSLYPCRDGWIFLGALSLGLALKAFAALGVEDEIDQDMLVSLFDKSSPHRSAVSEVLTSAFEKRETAEWLAVLSGAGVPASEVPEFASATTRPLFLQTASSRLVTVAEAPRGARSSGLPRGHLRVLEIAGYISGPFVGRLLSDFGAEVTKVEPPDGDPLRRQGLSFAAWNHGKTSIALDLTTPAGRVRVRELIAQSDVVITNYLPRTLDALGLDDESVFAVNPATVLVSVGGYGAGSGMESVAAFDPAIQAAFGLMRLQGGADEPVKPQIAASDYIAAMLATSGVLSALLHRRGSGAFGGYRVRTSLSAAGLLLARAAISQPGGVVPGGRDFKGREAVPSLYRCDDGWLAACSGETAMTRVNLESIARTLKVADAVQALCTAGVATAPCLAPDDLPQHPAFLSARAFHQVQDQSGNPVITPRIFGATPRNTHTPGLP